jgi:hypothetical protein
MRGAIALIEIKPRAVFRKSEHANCYGAPAIARLMTSCMAHASPAVCGSSGRLQGRSNEFRQHQESRNDQDEAHGEHDQDGSAEKALTRLGFVDLGTAGWTSVHDGPLVGFPDPNAGPHQRFPGGT